ncbi:hypothetical protein CoNPh17_CDS0146 [Staphylococcus phage S-CoN_Ph17]|nr:hypothetical protein CoNPh17_CDS0146 [Staphylococcus phage S-CoN_Ph17]
MLGLIYSQKYQKNGFNFGVMSFQLNNQWHFCFKNFI